jgi:hypothetical protein
LFYGVFVFNDVHEGNMFVKINFVVPAGFIVAGPSPGGVGVTGVTTVALDHDAEAQPFKFQENVPSGTWLVGSELQLGGVYIT